MNLINSFYSHLMKCYHLLKQPTMGYPDNHLGIWPPFQATSQHDIHITYPKLNKSRRPHTTINHISGFKQETEKI